MFGHANNNKLLLLKLVFTITLNLTQGCLLARSSYELCHQRVYLDGIIKQQHIILALLANSNCESNLVGRKDSVVFCL